MPLGEEIPLERGHQRGVPPLEIVFFTSIGSSSVKTVADRHNGVRLNPLGSGSPPYECVKFGYRLQNARFLLLSSYLARE